MLFGHNMGTQISPPFVSRASGGILETPMLIIENLYTSFAQRTTNLYRVLELFFYHSPIPIQHFVSNYLGIIGQRELLYSSDFSYAPVSDYIIIGYSLVACTPCLYCQATQHCGFKIEIAMQSF